MRFRPTYAAWERNLFATGSFTTLMDAYLNELSERFARMRPRLEVVAARILGNHSDAADTVSDVYIALIRTPPLDPEALGAWLLVSVRNRAINRLRKDRRESRGGPSPGIQETLPPELDKSLADLISDAITQLSDRDAAFVKDRFFEGAPAEKLAVQHGTSVPQARIVLHRAIRRLRKHLVLLLAEYHEVPPAHREAVMGMVAKGQFEVECRCAACVALDDELSVLRRLRLALPYIARRGSRSWIKQAAVGMGAAAIMVGLGPGHRVPDAAATPSPSALVAPDVEGDDASRKDLQMIGRDSEKAMTAAPSTSPPPATQRPERPPITIHKLGHPTNSLSYSPLEIPAAPIASPVEQPVLAAPAPPSLPLPKKFHP